MRMLCSSTGGEESDDSSNFGAGNIRYAHVRLVMPTRISTETEQNRNCVFLVKRFLFLSSASISLVAYSRRRGTGEYTFGVRLKVTPAYNTAIMMRHKNGTVAPIYVSVEFRFLFF